MCIGSVKVENGTSHLLSYIYTGTINILLVAASQAYKFGQHESINDT